MAYKSIYKPKNPRKYIGHNISRIVCRSTWERGLCRYCDFSDKVKEWSLECVIIPYLDELCIKERKYYMDFYIKLQNGRKLLVEVKPFNQTHAPSGFKKNYDNLKRLLTEAPSLIHNDRIKKKYGNVIQFSKNKNKWNAAYKFADEHNLEFQIWTEHTLRKLGIRIKKPNRKYKANVKTRYKNRKRVPRKKQRNKL